MDEYMKVAGPEAELSHTELVATGVAAPLKSATRSDVPGGAAPAKSPLAKSIIQALGGATNIERVEAVAATRLRVVVGNDAQVSDDGLRAAGVNAVMRLPNHVIHLVVGPNAERYALEVAAQLA